MTMTTETGISLTRAEYAAILRGHRWIRTVDPYADISRGWAELLVELLDAIDVVMAEIVDEHPEAHDFTTKSKFGCLRVFFALAGVSEAREAIWHALRAPIERAEAKSARTCERCGAPGRLREVDEWLTTLCDAHAGERRAS